MSFLVGYLVGAAVGFALLFLFGDKILGWMMRRWPL